MSVPLTKPRLRGWLHLGMAPLVLIAGLVFTAFAPTLLGRVGSAIYTLAAVQLFGTSAAYHRGTWSDRTNAVFRRIDHSNIFVFIAGTIPLGQEIWLTLVYNVGGVVVFLGLAILWYERYIKRLKVSDPKAAADELRPSAEQMLRGEYVPPAEQGDPTPES